MSTSPPFPTLNSAYDKEDEGDVVLKDQPSPRPRDAATLILVRRDGAQPRFLMGKRSRQHAFMPEKYVFPGGRVDPLDARAPILSDLSERTRAKLAIGTRRTPRAFALTAIRETYEETGLIVGQTGCSQASVPADWRAYYADGVMPCLHGLTFIGRAITPPYRPKRFDARFFMADAEAALIDKRAPLDGVELSDLQWVTQAQAMALDLPSVTAFMLDEIATRLADPSQDYGPQFVRWTRGGHQISRL